jgi:hypothetical protein
MHFARSNSEQFAALVVEDKPVFVPNVSFCHDFLIRLIYEPRDLKCVHGLTPFLSAIDSLVEQPGRR